MAGTCNWLQQCSYAPCCASTVLPWGYINLCGTNDLLQLKICSPRLAAGPLLLLLLLSLLLPEASSQGLDVTLAQLAADAQAVCFL
jgi:hypothetical protein